MSKKRRTYSAEFKLETVMEGLRGEKPIAQICRDRDITDSLYYKWRDQFKTHAPDIFARQDQQDQVVSKQEARIADLERMVGKLAMENEILKKSNVLAGWSIAEKRAMIDQLKDEYPVRQLCETLDCPPSTYYYQSQAASDGDLISAIEDLLMRRPFFGYRRVLKQLQRAGWRVGETRVRRVLKEMGHTAKIGRVRVRTTDSSHPHWRYPNLLKHIKPTYPDHVWVADITYIRLGWRFIYLAVILDAYTRAVRGWALSRQIDEELTLAALKMALNKGTPSIFHSDQGSQYTAWRHTQRLTWLGVRISMSDTGQPTQNGLVERFIGILKQEHVDFTEYEDFDDACYQLKQWLEVDYMTERIHSALDYQTPADFEAAALGQPIPLL